MTTVSRATVKDAPLVAELLDASGPVGLLDELDVAPAHRGQGIGAMLLTAAEQVVLERGGELLEVEVDDDGEGSRRFYERHGYRCTEPGSEHLTLCFSGDLA